jgi:uncharacterized protein (TIGR00369 family)
MKDQRGLEGVEVLTHTPEELLTHYYNAMRGHPVAALEMDEYSVHRIVVRARFEHDHTRPGGMVSGPNLFTLADAMAYFVTMSRSPRGSQAYTASISMEFLTPAPVGVLFVEGKLLRFGRRSSVVDTLIRRAEREELIAHAVVTYAPVFPGQSQIST